MRLKPGSARRVLPGFNLTLGYTLLHLSLIVLIPLSALIFKTFSMSWADFWAAVSAPRVLASFRLTFGASLIAACVNVVAGLLVAWVLVRYEFPGKRTADALVDLPFALPTAVAGIALTAILAGNGWIGQYLEPLGIQLAFQPAGIVIALDREERASDGDARSAARAVAEEQGIPVVAVARLGDLLAFAGENATLAADRQRPHAYRARYGVAD